MKFLVFDNQPKGLGQGKDLVLNWDNVKAIKPNSSKRFRINLNNKAILVFTMKTGTAQDVIASINRLLTSATTASKILRVKPATPGGFSFENISYIANAVTPSHIGQSDNMFGSEENPINAVSTGFVQLAKNPTQQLYPSFSSNSTIEAFQIVKVDDDIVDIPDYDLYSDFQGGYSAPGDELRMYFQSGLWKMQFRSNWGNTAWITQIHDLFNSGNDQLTITINISGSDETHTIPAGIWTIEYWNSNDQLRITTPDSNWPFSTTGVTAGINYGTNPCTSFIIPKFTKRQVYYYPNVEFYTPNVLPEYRSRINSEYNPQGGPELFSTNPTLSTGIYTDSSNTNPNTEFNALMDWFMWDDTEKRWGPYENLPDAFNPDLQTDGVVQFVKNKNYAALLLGNDDYNPFFTSYYQQSPTNVNGQKQTTLHGTAFVGAQYDDDTGQQYWPENYSPNVFEISSSWKFIDIRQPGNYGTNYGPISGTGSSKTWAYQNYGAIRFRYLRSYADNAAAVADNFPQDGLYMADGTGTIEKGTLMRRY